MYPAGSERPDGESFGFTVLSGANGIGLMPPDNNWLVYLPHQCSTWDIAEALHGEAVERLERFIAEAQAALVALREQVEWP